MEFHFHGPCDGQQLKPVFPAFNLGCAGWTLPLHMYFKTHSEIWSEFIHRISYVVLCMFPMLFDPPKMCLLVLQAYKNVDFYPSF